MYKFFWKLSFTLHIKTFGGLSFKKGWKLSEEIYLENIEYNLKLSASEASFEAMHSIN